MTETLQLKKSTSKGCCVPYELVEKAISLAEEVKVNCGGVLQEWNQIKQNWLKENYEQLPHMLLPDGHPVSDTVNVPARHLERLKAEIKQMKQLLPKVVNPDYTNVFHRLQSAEEDVKRLEREVGHCSNEREHWKSRYQTTLDELEREKAEKLEVQCEMSELNKQLVDQSEYCATLGSAVCTILWRVSRHEDTIESFLVGSKVDDFLVMVHHTLESYVATYQDEMPEEQSNEAQFVLALCGIITNIAASAYGREFLVTTANGKTLLGTMCSVLSNVPVNHSAKLRNLILMCLYNVSINQKGLKYVTHMDGIIPLLAWLLTAEKEVENQAHTLMLLQSITSASDDIFLLHQVIEVLPMEVLEKFANSRNQDIKETALEMMVDLKTLQTEP